LKLFEEIDSEGKRIYDYISTYPIDVHYTANTDIATLENLIQDFRNITHAIRNEPAIYEGWRSDEVVLFTTLLEEGQDSEDADKLSSREL